MFNNYLTSLWRYVSKNKAFTLINVAGLIIGMLACMLIAQFVLHELSYDNFHEKKNQIFRLQLDRYDKGELSTQWAAGAGGIGPDLKANFPEVKEFARLTQRSSTLSVGDVFFREDNIYSASEGFFKIFSIKLIEGIDSIVLRDPFKIVVSQSLAKKYFGSENALGKVFEAGDGTFQLQVSAVMKDMPHNSHFHFDFLMSNETLRQVAPKDLFTNPCFIICNEDFSCIL